MDSVLEKSKNFTIISYKVLMLNKILKIIIIKS